MASRKARTAVLAGAVAVTTVSGAYIGGILSDARKDQSEQAQNQQKQEAPSIPKLDERIQKLERERASCQYRRDELQTKIQQLQARQAARGSD